MKAGGKHSGLLFLVGGAVGSSVMPSERKNGLRCVTLFFILKFFF